MDLLIRGNIIDLVTFVFIDTLTLINPAISSAHFIFPFSDLTRTQSDEKLMPRTKIQSPPIIAESPKLNSRYPCYHHHAWLGWARREALLKAIDRPVSFHSPLLSAAKTVGHGEDNSLLLLFLETILGIPPEINLEEPKSTVR